MAKSSTGAKPQLGQRMIRDWKESTGATEVDMHEVAKYALQHGWRPPPPVTVVDLVAKELARYARLELKHDQATNKPYRVWHAYRGDQSSGQKQVTFWVDIDEADRKRMEKSLKWRREMMIDDGVQLKNDADHWNRINAGKAEPIQIAFDLTPDIQWREAGEDDVDDEEVA
jgi:hypothetical protein